MAFNALKRIINPAYRVVVDMEHGAIFIQRQNFWGKWKYLEDALGNMEFSFVHHAFSYIDVMNERRNYSVSLLIRFKGE